MSNRKNKRITLTGTKIKNADEALVCLSEIRALHLEHAALVTDREREVLEVEQQYAGRIEGTKTELEQHTADLREWADNNPTVFGQLRSVEWTHGRFGWRISPPKLVKKSKQPWDDLTPAVRDNLGPKYVRVQESVNRERIIADRESIEPAKLRVCGLSVVQEETFFVEPKIEDTAPKPTATP